MKIEKLSPENYSKVLTLFNPEYPNLAFAFGIIDGILPGQIWVDSENSPSVCLIISNIDYCFISGNLDEGIFVEFLGLLKDKATVKLVCEPNSHDNQINFSKYEFKLVPRVQYRYKMKISEMELYPNNSKYILKKINDHETFKKCIWESFLTKIYGEKNNYLKFSMGFILWDAIKNQVASEAHGVISKGLIEVGTITHEDYRNQGLSTIVCNQLICAAIKKGLYPIWTCDEANIASNKVAQHQGMDDIKDYTFQTLTSNNS